MKRGTMFAIGIVLVLGAIGFILSGNKPEFFDIFGILVFSFLLGVGYWMLKTKRRPSWLGFVILIIGVLGLIVDGYIVIKTSFFGS